MPQPVAVIAAADLMTLSRLEHHVASCGWDAHRHPVPPEPRTAPGTAPVQAVSPLSPGSVADWPAAAAVLILSLDTISSSWQSLMAAARQREMLIIGTGSHHDSERLQTARQAGCDAIVTNRRLPQRLPNLLAAAGDGGSP